MCGPYDDSSDEVARVPTKDKRKEIRADILEEKALIKQARRDSKSNTKYYKHEIAVAQKNIKALEKQLAKLPKV